MNETTQSLRRELLKAELLESRDLTPEEKTKSMDYWKGYTAAVVRVFKLL